MSNLFLKIATTASQAALTFTNRQFADNRLYFSTSLPGVWTLEALGIEITTPVTNTVQRAIDAPRRFYSMAQVQYASSTFAPKTLYGRTLTLNFTVGPGLITIVFNSSGGGTFTWASQPSGTVADYVWTQAPYRGSLWPLQLSGLVPMTLWLNFTSNIAGAISGTAYFSDGSSASVSGTFSLNGP